MNTDEENNNFEMIDVTQRHLVIKRGLITFLITLIYIALSTIPLPCLNNNVLANVLTYHARSLQIISLLDGSNLRQGSILMIGLMPFITIQLVIQILQTKLSKKVKLLSETSTGQQKIGRLTKLLVIPLAFTQGVVTLFTLNKLSKQQLITTEHYPLFLVIAYLAIVITTCTLIIIWLSDLNTLYGLGNGLNYLISCSIIVGLIQNSSLTSKIVKQWMHALGSKFIWIALLTIVILWAYNALCIWFQSSFLSLPLQFSQLNSSINKTGSLPFSLNIANVMPICFASVIMNVLYMFSLWDKSLSHFQYLANFKTWSSIGFYALMLIVFTYICTFIPFYPPNLAENLNRQNIYIQGVAPTLQTVSYLRRVLMKLATGNVIFLTLVIIIPMIVCKLCGLEESLVLSSSTIFILVTTEIDIRRQIGGLRAKANVPTLVK